MIKNLNAQVVPLVVYQNKLTNKTVAGPKDNITRKFGDHNRASVTNPLKIFDLQNLLDNQFLYKQEANPLSK